MFTSDEIEMLDDGLQALLKEASTDTMMGMMLSAMLAPDKENRDKLMDEQISKFEDKHSEQRLLEKRVMLLRAKLVQLEDKMLVHEVSDELNDK